MDERLQFVARRLAGELPCAAVTREFRLFQKGQRGQSGI
jgi:hypothetical protein